MQGSNQPRELAPWGSALRIFEFSAPFCLGETHHYFKQCNLFHSFHAIVEVQFGGLARLDRAVNNYKDNLNSLYRHPDLTLTTDKALRNVIMSAYSHYIDLWPMNGACMGAPCSPHEKHVAVHHALRLLLTPTTLPHHPVQKKGASPINATASYRSRHPPHRQGVKP